MKPRILTQKRIERIRGEYNSDHAKTLGTVKRTTALNLLAHIDALHETLDSVAGDAFGTWGWRHAFGMECKGREADE